MFEKKSSIDKPLLFLLLALFVVGLTALYSAGGEARFYQQLERGGVAILFMFTLSLLNLRWQQAFALSFFLVVLLALFAVLGFGVKINNARRWLNIGFYVQPSEFMKVALPLGLAFLYARLSELRWWHHLAFLAMTAFVGILVLLQPDLGTAVVIFMVGVATVFFAGIGWRWIAGFSVLGVASLPLFWLFFLKAYQRKRIITMFDPFQDPLGSGYHTIQSQIAVGSGGVWGKGFQSGTQAQLGFLPERHTDFIFAVYAEEFGLAGAVLLLFLALLITWRCLLIAGRTSNVFGRLAIGGIISGFFGSFIVNLYMVSGLLPVVGMPLPLVSYGGTALLATFIGFGAILSVARNNTKR
ncbi:MAG: rod shape-determining protein RodA [Candidatus Zeuxoniibacter abyssi]|nr:MAG: rod shape-determining protein RodA [Candidatus Persebacteraceae bacterium AB1(2)]